MLHKWAEFDHGLSSWQACRMIIICFEEIATVGLEAGVGT